MEHLIISQLIFAICLILTLPYGIYQCNPYKRKSRQQFGYSNAVDDKLAYLIRFSHKIGQNLPDKLNYNKKKIIQWLKLSGYEDSMTIESVLGFRFIAIITTITYFLMMYLVSNDITNFFLMCFGAGLSAVSIDQWLYIKVISRQRALQKDIPTVLGTIAILMDAGLNLLPAIQEAASQHEGILSLELKKTLSYITLGVSQESAFLGMVDRCGTEEINYFVSAIIQGIEKGSVGLGNIVREQANESWEKRMHRAKQLAEKASIKLFMPLLFLVFPAVMIFLLGPMVFSIFKLF